MFVSVSYPIRWTDEARRVIHAVLKVIDQLRLKRYGMLVLTNGFGFKIEHPENTLIEFAQYLWKIGEQEKELQKFLKIFYDETMMRAMILNTEKKDISLNEPQLKQFYSDIGDRRFDVQHYLREPYYNYCTVL